MSDVVILSEADSWSYLRSRDLGRLSIAAGGRPSVFPVNYAVAGGTIVFRTAPGAKMTYGPGNFACFEVDGYDRNSTEGWSVMAFGTLAEITHAEDELNRSLRALRILPAAPGERMHWIALRVAEVSGRWFSGGWIVPGGYLG
jgi:nitroimidazol reductase NimA-like FMN-containing flavoprotein (pyridoxamine 5'-phosphate oxidase superfamily)